MLCIFILRNISNSSLVSLKCLVLSISFSMQKIWRDATWHFKSPYSVNSFVLIENDVSTINDLLRRKIDSSTYLMQFKSLDLVLKKIKVQCLIENTVHRGSFL